MDLSLVVGIVIFAALVLFVICLIAVQGRDKLPEDPPVEFTVKISFDPETPARPKRSRTRKPRAPKVPLEPQAVIPNLGWDGIPQDHQVAIFLDTETTGLGHRDELVELAIVAFCFDPKTGMIAGTCETYEGQRQPGCPINPFAQRKHKLTVEALAGKYLDQEKIESLLAQASFLIAHNADFDYRFVCALFPTAAAKTWLCSMAGIDWHAAGMGSRALEYLVKAHGISSRTKHRALSDVLLSLCLLQKRNGSGETFLFELLRNSGHNEQFITARA